MPEKLTIHQHKKRMRRQRKAVTVFNLALAALIALATMLTPSNKVEFVGEKYIVCEGDTLWGIYTQRVENVKWDFWLHEMRTVNDLDSDVVLTAGEELIILTTK